MPLRVILLGNLVNWVVCSVFAMQSSIVLLTIGMVVWLTLIPVIEAAEQTVLQRAIPFERQGRVFGFAQLVENAAAPLTAFAIAPIAETVFMPFMTDGRRRRPDRRLVRHRSRAGPGPHVHPRRPRRDRRHRAWPGSPAPTGAWPRAPQPHPPPPEPAPVRRFPARRARLGG